MSASFEFADLLSPESHRQHPHLTVTSDMPSPPTMSILQRELADSIIRFDCLVSHVVKLKQTLSRFAPLDEIRILLACGAKLNEPVTQGTVLPHQWMQFLVNQTTLMQQD